MNEPATSELPLVVYHDLLEEAQEVAENALRRLQRLVHQYPDDLPAELLNDIRRGAPQQEGRL